MCTLGNVYTYIHMDSYFALERKLGIGICV